MGNDETSDPTARTYDPNTWAGVIHDLLEQYSWSQSELARQIRVSQQTISAWLAGNVDAPTIQTVRAVYELGGDSMLRLISVAYGWPLETIAQRAVLDAAIVDESLEPQERDHLINQYDILMRSSRAKRSSREQVRRAQNVLNAAEETKRRMEQQNGGSDEV